MCACSMERPWSFGNDESYRPATLSGSHGPRPFGTSKGTGFLGYVPYTVVFGPASLPLFKKHHTPDAGPKIGGAVLASDRAQCPNGSPALQGILEVNGSIVCFDSDNFRKTLLASRCTCTLLL